MRRRGIAKSSSPALSEAAVGEGRDGVTGAGVGLAGGAARRRGCSFGIRSRRLGMLLAVGGGAVETAGALLGAAMTGRACDEFGEKALLIERCFETQPGVNPLERSDECTT